MNPSSNKKMGKALSRTGQAPPGPRVPKRVATLRPKKSKPLLEAASLEYLPNPFPGDDQELQDPVHSLEDDTQTVSTDTEQRDSEVSTEDYPQVISPDQDLHRVDSRFVDHQELTSPNQLPFELSPNSRAALKNFKIDVDCYPHFPKEMKTDDFDPVAGTINPALLLVPTHNSGIDPRVEDTIRTHQQNGTLFQTMVKASNRHHELQKALKEATNPPASQTEVNVPPTAAATTTPATEPKLSSALANANPTTPDEIQAYNQALFDETYQEIMDDLNNNQEARAQRAMPAQHYRNPVTGLTHEEERNLAKAAFKPGASDVFMGAPAFPVNPDLSDPLGIGDNGFDYSKAFDDDTTYSLQPHFDNLESRRAPIPNPPVPTAPAARASAAAASRAASRKAAGKAPASSSRVAGRGAPVLLAGDPDNPFTRPKPPPTEEQLEFGMHFEAEFNRIMSARGHDPARDLREAETPWRQNDWVSLQRNLNEQAQVAMENTLYHPDMNLRGIPAADRTSTRLREEDRILAQEAIMDHRDHPNPSHIAAINRGRQNADTREAVSAAPPKAASRRKRPASSPTQQPASFEIAFDDDDDLHTGQSSLTRAGPFAGPEPSNARTPQVTFATPSQRRGGQPQTPQTFTTPSQQRAPGASRTPATSTGRGPTSILKKPATARRNLPDRESAPSPQPHPQEKPINPVAFFPSYNAMPSQPYDTHMSANQSANQDLLQGIDLRPSTDFTRNNPGLAHLPIDVALTPGFLPVTDPATAPDDGDNVQQPANVASTQQMAATPTVAQAQVPAAVPTATAETVQPAHGTQPTQAALPMQATQPVPITQPAQASQVAQATAVGASKGYAGLADISPPPSRPGTSAGPQNQG